MIFWSCQIKIYRNLLIVEIFSEPSELIKLLFLFNNVVSTITYVLILTK